MKTSEQKIFESAITFINTEPKPENIIELLDELRNELPDEFLERFDDLYEAAIAA
jgi:hypothetical protein